MHDFCLIFLSSIYSSHFVMDIAEQGRLNSKISALQAERSGVWKEALVAAAGLGQLRGLQALDGNRKFEMRSVHIQSGSNTTDWTESRVGHLDLLNEARERYLCSSLCLALCSDWENWLQLSGGVCSARSHSHMCFHRIFKQCTLSELETISYTFTCILIVFVVLRPT